MIDKVPSSEAERLQSVFESLVEMDAHIRKRLQSGENLDFPYALSEEEEAILANPAHPIWNSVKNAYEKRFEDYQRRHPNEFF